MSTLVLPAIETVRGLLEDESTQEATVAALEAANSPVPPDLALAAAPSLSDMLASATEHSVA